MTKASPVLVSWVAVNNDPFERDRETGEARLVGGERVPGPTLTLLCDEESSYAGQVSDVVLLHRSPHGGETSREQRAVEKLSTELRERPCRVHLEAWEGDDQTDHRKVFNFLRDKIPELRHRLPGREFALHISRGTPSMHTVWVLMAETGFIDPPSTVVKSYRRAERCGRAAVVPVGIGIETFYKVYKASRPRHVGSDDQVVIWDPHRFRTDAMKRLFTEARRFAQRKVPVLIRGQRGTGKTTLASWIRSNSPFKPEEQDARWPSVACGQYNPETMRAELFGYKKGSFTGATSDRPRLLAAAHRDTLFLDEIGDVSRHLQRLLIRAIEEKCYFALGDDTRRVSDFRLLTATNATSHQYGPVAHVREATIYAVGGKEVYRFKRDGIDLSTVEGVQVVCSDSGVIMTVYRNRTSGGCAHVLGAIAGTLGRRRGGDKPWVGPSTNKTSSVAGSTTTPGGARHPCRQPVHPHSKETGVRSLSRSTG